MPRGVAKDFLRVLEEDTRAHRVRFGVLVAVALVLFAPAWLLLSLWGPVWHLGGLVVGAALGVLMAHLRTKRFEDDLRGRWNAWMKYSLACESVAEIHRRVRGRSGRQRVFLLAAVLTTVWALEVLMLALVLSGNGAGLWSAVAIAANGLLIGDLAGAAVRSWRWTRAFRRSLQDLMDAGELGAWGVVA